MKSLSIRACITSVLLLAVSACGTSGGKVPEDRFYRLPEPAMQQTVSRVADILIVKPVEPLDALRAQTVTRTDRSGIALEHYKHHRWASPPARLVQAHLVANLRRSGLADTVVDKPVLGSDQLTLRLQLERFERVIDGQLRSAAVTVRAELSNAAGKAPLGTERFSAEVSASSVEMENTIVAFGKALDQVSAELVSWIAQESTSS
ncbi:MAG: hypothetical protein DHS20C11_12980 [Lysobacteraceae bacterium]|nr:MAG: hypothetical protein DHS20C11_12980 [Xanthomonadaceae bacterium]